MPAEGLTAVELATVIRQSKLDVDSVKRISQWLEAVEAAQYNAQTTPNDSTADAGIELARRLQQAIG